MAFAKVFEDPALGAAGVDPHRGCVLGARADSISTRPRIVPAPAPSSVVAKRSARLLSRARGRARRPSDASTIEVARAC